MKGQQQDEEFEGKREGKKDSPRCLDDEILERLELLLNFVVSSKKDDILDPWQILKVGEDGSVLDSLLKNEGDNSDEVGEGR